MTHDKNNNRDCEKQSKLAITLDTSEQQTETKELHPLFSHILHIFSKPTKQGETNDSSTH